MDVPEVFTLRDANDGTHDGAAPQVTGHGVLIDPQEKVWAAFQTRAVLQINRSWLQGRLSMFEHPDRDAFQQEASAVERGLARYATREEANMQRLAYEVAAGAHGDWVGASEMNTVASIRICDARVLVEWPRWRSDRRLGSFFERRIAARFLFKNSVFCGHVRAAWVSRVGVSPGPRGRTAVAIQFGWDSPDYRLRLADVPDGENLARTLATRLAQERLRTRSGPEPADQQQLQALVEGHAQAGRDDTGTWYDLPGSILALPAQS